MYIFPNNSRVIFTGDSITAHSKYTVRIVDYYRRELKERNVKFYQAAIPGATLEHAIKYFDDLIVPFNPTHATVFFGINDCGREYLDIADKERRDDLLSDKYRRFCSALSTYLDMLISHNITPILITPAPYAEYLYVQSSNLRHGQKLSFEYAEVIRSEAKRRGLELIDLHARISELYLFEDIYTPDRVHPSEYGHYRTAGYVLQSQDLEIGAYKTLEEIFTNDPPLQEWACAVSQLGDLYCMYVCVKPELYDMTSKEQINFVEKYVQSQSYGDSEVAREFSNRFLIYKPQEKQYYDIIRRFNGDLD